MEFNSTLFHKLRSDDYLTITEPKKERITSTNHRKTSTEELDRMVEEATVDAYGDEEMFMGILYALSDNLAFPFKAKVLGATVEVIGIDDHNSRWGRGILAQVKKSGREYTIGVVELELEPDDTRNAKWIEMFHYWLKRY
jgi:hypothetical protein